jgi:CDP-paratose 2-epimerase
MKYLITGGCGFLGSNIAARLIGEGAPVAILDNLSRLGATRNLSWLQSIGEFSFQVGDVRNRDDVEALVRAYEPDVVFHLAGQVAMTTSLKRPRLDFETNVVGSFNVLETLREHVPEAVLVYSSTNKVYGDLEHLAYAETATRYELPDYPAGIPESLTLDFHSPYGCSKGAADQYVLDYHRMFGLRSVVFRHSSMYGGRQFATIDQGWVGWFCSQALRQAAGDDTPFTVSGNGKQVRDLLHADDMVDLYLAAAHQIDRTAGQAFNIGGGTANSLSIIELLARLEAITGTPLRRQHIETRSSDQKVFVADLRKIGAATGWTPKVGVDEGLRRMMDWANSGMHHE